ncbi:MAG: hypothetical protein MK052_02755 [Alphaproteobacteria bacterium]|nr:hypothetical protein [Alphaproteobacteria bacterium]
MTVILATFILATFVFSTVANTAMAACNCSDMQSQASQSTDDMRDMPCHKMDKADKDSTKADSNKIAKCDSCGCGDCNITVAAMFPMQLLHNQAINATKAVALVSDHMKSLFPYGIDYPPKHIS